MSSLWWLCTAQWRRGKGEQRGERGEGSGRDSTGLQGGGEAQAWQRRRGGKRVLRKGWRGVDKGVRRKEGARTEGFRTRKCGMRWCRKERGQSTIQLATTGLSPRHCQPDNGLISLLFTPVWLTGRNGRKRRGRGKGTSLYQPSKCQRMGQAPGLASWLEYTSLRKRGQF